VQIQPDIRRIRAAHIFNIQAYGNEQGKKQKQAAGGFGAVLMNGVKRGLFSNEAGSGSAPCAAAAAEERA